MYFLEDKWQHLLKLILVYITCEGRYNRVMIYHFKLMNHFIGRSPLNLPYYLHRSLTKMDHQVKAKPSKVVGRLPHHGLIKLLIYELLQRRNKDWGNCLFWNEFQTHLQPEDKKGSSSRKSSTPKSGKRKRRAISLVAVDQSSPSSKSKKAKKKLDFSKDAEKAEEPSVDKNILNLPYTDSEDEEDQVAIEKEVDPTEDPVTIGYEDLTSPTPKEDQGQNIAEASSSKSKQSRSQKIKKLKEKITQQEVLEKVIKTQYETLSKNFIATNAALEILALENVKEKKKKKKIVKDYNSLWRVAMHLKKKVKSLSLQAMPSKLHPQASIDIETLANATIHLNDLETTNNPTTIPEPAQDAKASEDQP
jgi:hypothetical protein